MGIMGQFCSSTFQKIEAISRSTRNVVRSFRRNDVRIRKEIGVQIRQKKERESQSDPQLCFKIYRSRTRRQIVWHPVFEDITNLRNLYRKGNFQGKNFRSRMNSVPWY